MAIDPLKARALILLSKGYESAHEGKPFMKPFILDGDVARAAQVEADTPEHAAAVDYLVMEGAVEFVGDGYQHLPRSTTLYEITERGLEMLGN